MRLIFFINSNISHNFMILDLLFIVIKKPPLAMVKRSGVKGAKVW